MGCGSEERRDAIESIRESGGDAQEGSTESGVERLARVNLSLQALGLLSCAGVV